MSKLKNEYKNYVNGYVGSSMLTNTEYPETINANAEKCANTSKDFTEAFVIWFIENCMYNKNENRELKDIIVEFDENVYKTF